MINTIKDIKNIKILLENKKSYQFMDYIYNLELSKKELYVNKIKNLHNNKNDIKNKTYLYEKEIYENFKKILEIKGIDKIEDTLLKNNKNPKTIFEFIKIYHMLNYDDFDDFDDDIVFDIQHIYNVYFYSIFDFITLFSKINNDINTYNLIKNLCNINENEKKYISIKIINRLYISISRLY